MTCPIWELLLESAVSFQPPAPPPSSSSPHFQRETQTGTLICDSIWRHPVVVSTCLKDNLNDLAVCTDVRIAGWALNTLNVRTYGRTDVEASPKGDLFSFDLWLWDLPHLLFSYLFVKEQWCRRKHYFSIGENVVDVLRKSWSKSMHVRKNERAEPLERTNWVVLLLHLLAVGSTYIVGKTT